MSKKQNKSKLLTILAFFLLIIIFVLVFLMGKVFQSNYKEYKEVDETQDKIIEDAIDKKTDNEFSIDWNNLKSINKDIIAWIRIPDTNISYPIVQGSRNNQYLHKNIYGKYSKGGTPFVDCNIKDAFHCSNTIVYGHNLMNGAVFSQLKQYQKQSYADKHNIVYIYLPNGEVRQYEVMSFHIVKADDKDIYNPYVESIEEYKTVMLKNNKLTNKDIKVYENAEVLTLSTCTNKGNTRYVLHTILQQ